MCVGECECVCVVVCQRVCCDGLTVIVERNGLRDPSSNPGISDMRFTSVYYPMKKQEFISSIHPLP